MSQLLSPVNVLQLVRDGLYSDFAITAGNRTYPLHKVVLTGRSRFFFDLLHENPGLTHLDLDDDHPITQDHEVWMNLLDRWYQTTKEDHRYPVVGFSRIGRSFAKICEALKAEVPSLKLVYGTRFFKPYGNAFEKPEEPLASVYLDQKVGSIFVVGFGETVFADSVVTVFHRKQQQRDRRRKNWKPQPTPGAEEAKDLINRTIGKITGSHCDDLVKTFQVIRHEYSGCPLFEVIVNGKSMMRGMTERGFVSIGYFIEESIL